jgi:peptidoglycan/LPS O-acetylase OafA/YrhL
LFYVLLSYAVYVIVWVICVLAFWRGDRPLKAAAVTIIFFWSITPLFSHFGRTGWNMPVTIIDTNATLVLLWISLRWRTLWSAVLVALSFLQVLAPFVALWDGHIHPFYWMSAYTVLGYVVLAVLAVATWQTTRARRRANEGSVQP